MLCKSGSCLSCFAARFVPHCNFLRVHALGVSCNPTPRTTPVEAVEYHKPPLYNSPMEPTEISEFVEDVEKGGESKLKHVSLAISILAVLVAMVTVLGHRSHTEAVLSQSRAADQWNLYQAKKMRQAQYAVTADLLSLQPNSNAAAVEKKLEDYRKRDEKANDDLKEEQDRAREIEGEVAKTERRASRYDLGEALLQIAVVLSSITLLTRQQRYFAFGLLLGLAGAIIAATGLLL